MIEIKERVNQWLRDAHAMEVQAEQLLNGQARRSDRLPALRAKLEQHLDETRGQRIRLEQCIEHRGTSTSNVKDIAARVTGAVQNLSGLFVEDEIVKSVLANYTFEHMEIASYRILMAAAQADGDVETAKACETSYNEEVAMAQWLADHLDEVTRTHLLREAVSPDEVTH